MLVISSVANAVLTCAAVVVDFCTKMSTANAQKGTWTTASNGALVRLFGRLPPHYQASVRGESFELRYTVNGHP